MSDKITTLHLKNDPSTNIYPNVKIENIPLDVTISRDGENLAKTKTIYEFTTSNFLPLNGGTMHGNIMTGGFASPEKTILGDGVEVVEESNPAQPVTHYGCGYIRQDDDEDSSIKYEYHFPKKSGTLALKDDFYIPELNTEFSTTQTNDYIQITDEEDIATLEEITNKAYNNIYPYGILVKTNNHQYFVNSLNIQVRGVVAIRFARIDSACYCFVIRKLNNVWEYRVYVR